MSKKEPEDRDGLLELIKNLWLPVAGFLGAITLAYNFYQLWLGDKETVTWFLAGGGLFLLLIILLWIGFGKKTVIKKAVFPRGAYLPPEKVDLFPISYKRAAWGALGLLVIFAIIGVISLLQHRRDQERYMAEQERKLIVVIAAFEGPEDVYGLRNEIIESLNTEFAGDENIEILPLEEIITVSMGSEYARSLGEDHIADIVIWGWYRPTENPNISIHIENLDADTIKPLDESTTLNPIVTLAEMESFSFQQQAGKETITLISFLAGYLAYHEDNFDKAIELFDFALENITLPPTILENHADIYYFRGDAYFWKLDNQSAIDNYTKAIEISSGVERYYTSRCVSYMVLELYESAINDCTIALDIEPRGSSSATNYSNRGGSYSALGQFQLAFDDFSKAIELEPSMFLHYSARGGASLSLENYEQAVSDFSMVIKLFPDFSMNIGLHPVFENSYYLRGEAYYKLKDYESSIADYSEYIFFNPDADFAYNSRAGAYSALNQFELAISDYSQAIRINSDSYSSYANRGDIYFILKKYEEAVDDYTQSIRIANYLPAYHNRGRIYRFIEKYDLAIADFSKIIDVQPNAPVYTDRGRTYISLKQYEDAIVDFNNALQIDSQYADAYSARGLAYNLIGEEELAIVDYTMAIHLDPQNPDNYMFRGLLYSWLGREQEAKNDEAKFRELQGQGSP